MRVKVDKYISYIYALLFLSVAVDAATGYLMLEGYISDSGESTTPSQLYRFLMLLFSFYILKTNRKYFCIVLSVSLWIFFIETLAAIIFHNSVNNLLVSLVWSSKVVYLFVVFYSLSIAIEIKGILHEDFLHYIVCYVLLVAVILIVSTALSINYSTYATGSFGSKGLFASGNGLGMFMGAGLLLSVYQFKLIGTKMSSLCFFIILIATMLIGTKTALIYSVIAIVLFSLVAGRSVFFVFVAVASVFLSVFFFSEIYNLFLSVFDVIVYRFENSNSVSAFLFSGRDIKLERALVEYNIESFYLIRVFTGMGAIVSYQNPLFGLKFVTVESDALDIFFRYGIAGLVFYICIYINILKKSKNFMLSLAVTLWFVGSFLVGHSLFNGMAGVLLPVFGVLAKSSKNVSGFRRRSGVFFEESAV